MVWMQQLWGVHSAVAFQMMFVFQDLGEMSSNALVNAFDSPLPLYNWVGGILFLLLTVLTIGFALSPQVLDPPFAVNILKWDQSVERRNKPKMHVSFVSHENATFQSDQDIESVTPQPSSSRRIQSQTSIAPRAPPPPFDSNVPIQIESQQTEEPETGQGQDLECEVGLPNYQTAVEIEAECTNRNEQQTESTATVAAQRAFESWQVPPPDDYVPNESDGSNVQLDFVQAQQLQQIATHMAEILSRPVEGSIELRRPTNSPQSQGRLGRWIIKRSSYSGNMFIREVPKWMRGMRSLMILFFHFVLYSIMTFTARFCLDWAMEQFVACDNTMRQYAMKALFRAAGVVPLLIFRRFRYLLLCSFLLMAYSLWRLYFQNRIESNLILLGCNLSFGVLLLPAAVLQHTQQTLEAALPIWEMMVIGFAIDYTRRFHQDLMNDAFVAKPLNWCLLALISLCFLTFAVVSLRKTFIRQHTAAGTHLQ